MKLTVFSIVILSYLTVSSAVKVSVYYETLCPDSIAFIKNQLHDNYKAFGEKNIQLELTPYGFATEKIVNGTKTFTCQHGADECYGNEVQGCVINSANIATSEDFVYCSEIASAPTSTQTFQKCAEENNLAWSDIEKCLSSGQAGDIMSQNGVKTDGLHPNWIPTIVFNDKFNDDDSKEAETNLKNVLCRYLDNEPDQCRSSQHVNVVLV